MSRYQIDPGEQKRPVDLGLNAADCEFLARAIDQWGGPARPSDPVAHLAAFTDAVEMREGLKRIRSLLEAQQEMTRRDWRRALIATEIVFGSDTYGAGVEWQTVTGLDDCESLVILRELQRKLAAVCLPGAS